MSSVFGTTESIQFKEVSDTSFFWFLIGTDTDTVYTVVEVIL